MDNNKLCVKANDYDGCDVISSLLQDSIFHIYAPSFHEDRGCLRLLLNRFCWESAGNSDNADLFRVHSGLYIYNVKSVVVNDNFKKIKEEVYLNLLTMHASQDEINILFSGHKSICIKIDGICVYLKDLHDRHPTLVSSNHECMPHSSSE
ncbi:hypothetical protein FACS189449_11880 [Alphaproteobacteria bacterium]|nr:hypothetical protein FACS189449_11880 [Alphaproteobacteria bacterium]